MAVKEDLPLSNSSEFHVVVGLYARRTIGCGGTSLTWTSDSTRRSVWIGDPENVRSIADVFADPPPSVWAWMGVGSSWLASGSQFLTDAGYVGLGSTQGVKVSGVYSPSVSPVSLEGRNAEPWLGDGVIPLVTACFRFLPVGVAFECTCCVFAEAGCAGALSDAATRSFV
jgi:hypothetical protein